MKNKLIICLLVIYGQVLLSSQQAGGGAANCLAWDLLGKIQSDQISFTNQDGVCMKNHDMDLVQTVRHVANAANRGLVSIPNSPMKHITWFDQPELAARITFANGDKAIVRFSQDTV